MPLFPIPTFIRTAFVRLRGIGKGMVGLWVFLFISSSLSAQVTTVNLDLSAHKDTSVTLNNAPARNGVTCGVSPAGNTNCIVFNVQVNPGADQISFEIIGASGLGSAAYQVNCGTPATLATPICLNGITTASISFCKNGNNAYTYKITTSTTVKGSADLTLRQNCSGTMSVTGLQASSVNWTSIYPGSAGQYNSYLSSTSGQSTVTVTPAAVAPGGYIDYRVYGSTSSCGNSKDDTIRVYTTAGLTAPITPANPAICNGSSVLLTATASGGSAPYTYSWSNGSSISTTTAAAVGTYTLTVSDNTSGCAPLVQSVTVTAAPTPAAPTIAGTTTICAGTSTTLTATAPGGTYRWYDAPSGGNLVFTGSSYTTPVLNSTSTYYVETTVASCPSSRTPVTVTVNALPPAPTVTGATICAGSTATLNATAPGGTYDWYTASSGGSLLFTGPGYTTPALNSSSTYYVQSTISGCTGPRTAVAVTVNTIPAAPTASAATVCANTSANLQATAPGGSYQWYDQSSGGTLLSSTAGYTTPLLASSTTYYVQTTISGCTSSRTAVPVNITTTPANPTAPGASICVGSATTLTATAPGGPYEWYSLPSGGTLLFSGASYTTPTLNSAATYYVQSGVTGCLSGRTAVTVTVNSIPAPPTAAGTTICAGGAASLTASTSGGTYQWYDAASAGNLLATGSPYTTPALISNTTYYVQSTVNGCSGSRTAVAVTVNAIPAAPTAAGATICTNSSAVLQATAPGGIYEWYNTASGGTVLASGASYTTPTLTSNTTYYVQSTIAGCTGSRTAVAVSVTAKPAAPTVAPVTICAGNATSLTASAPGGVYKWYDAASGGNLLTIGDTYSTVTLNTNTSFYVETTVAGCTGPRATAAVTVTPLPAAPTAAPGFACEGSTVSLTATAPGGIYQWYDAASGGNLLGGGASYTTGILNANAMFYVSATVAGCTGNRTTVPVTITPIPAAPSAAGGTICAGNSTNLTANAPGGSYEWYDAASSGNLLGTGNVYATGVLNTSNNYYVQTTISGCTSNRSQVTVNVMPSPVAPVAAGTSICAGNASVLTATAPGGLYQWFDAATGGNLLTTGASYATPVLNTNTSYYVQAVASGCAGPRTAVTVTVTPIPGAPTVAAASICEDNSASLTATAPGGTYQWFDAAAGGNLLATGNTYNTSLLTATTSYYVQTTVAGCPGARAAVTVTVIPKLNPAFQYSSGTFCITGQNPTPTISGSLAGTFSASPAGLVFISTATGQINVAASAPGTYTISFVTGGSCVYSSSSKIAITGSPNAAFSFNGPFCQQQQYASPSFVAGASAGVFSASPAGLVFVSNSTGEIDLAKTAAGTYTIDNVIAASAGCSAANASGTITVNASAKANAGADQTVCAGSIVQLNGSFNGSATSASWSGGLGSFSSKTALNAQYTPAAGETIARLYLTTDDPAGPCAAAVDSMTIFITPTPAAPVVSGAAVCTGTAATLIASAPGGTYDWYDAASGGNLLATAPSFTTPVLTAATTYYVRSTINNCSGSRAPVTVSVTPKPIITSVGSGTICTGSSFVYDITSSQPASFYTWTRNAVAGISNGAATGLTDGPITEVLNNTTSSPLNVTYTIVPTSNNCTGDPFPYIVTVHPTPATPVVTSSSPVCVGSTLSLATGAVTGASYAWKGPNNFSSSLQNPVLQNLALSAAGIYSVTVTVNGCSSQAGTKNIFPVIAAPAAGSNAPICAGSTLSLTAGNLAGASYQWTGPGSFSSLLQNPSIPSATPGIAGTYYVTASIAGCPGLTDSVKVGVNTPPVTPQISSNSPVCSRDSVTLTATSVPNASYQWSGPNGFSSNSQSPVIKKASLQNTGTYTVIASTPGCTITSNASLPVTVKLTPSAPAPGNNGPLCEGTSLNLFATPASGATYKWSSASGFSSAAQNPVIPNVSMADTGNYYVVATLNGCTGDTGVTKVAVVRAAVADAGIDQAVCGNNATVQLNGSITGDDTRSGIWKTDGTGRFFPNESTLNGRYIPSNSDTAKGLVTLTLSTSNNKVCAVSSSSAKVTISHAPVATAGPDKTVCSNDSLVSLTGLVANAGGGQWYTLGSGSFSRSGSGDLNPVYVPSRQDILKGQVLFYLATTNTGSCFAVYDTVQANIIAAPKVYAGADRTVFLDDKFTLTPIVTGSNLRYEWTPNTNIADNKLKNAVITAKANITYRLTVIGDSSCTSYDEIYIKVLKPIGIPNIFSPNGDGIHDTWEIPELNNYPGATVEIYTRGGIRIFNSVGYAKPWDGTYNGNPVPVATYYYIVNTRYNNQVFSGSVTVIR